jgi:hypothetical protein
MMDLQTYKLILTVVCALTTLGMHGIAFRNIAHDEPGALGDLASAWLCALVTLGMTLALGLGAR